MPVTRTERFALHRWDSGADQFNRTQVDTDNLQIETLAALFRVGPVASIGDPTGPENAKSFYYATDSAVLYFSDGSNWVSLSDTGEQADIAPLTIEATPTSSAGTTSTASTIKTQEFALANHRHALPAPGTPVDTGTANQPGDATTIARSNHVHAIGSGSINSSSNFAAGVVNATALASDSVTTAKILNANVTAAKLASDSVTTAKILDANVTAAKLATDVAGDGLASTNGILSVNVDNSTIEINSDTLRIKDSGITAVKLNSDVAGSGLGSALGVLSINVDNSTVEINSDTLRLKDGGVSAAKLASDSVTTAKILDVNVTAGKLASDSVTTAKILDANVTAGKLASDSVTTAKIVDANVTAGKLATDSVTTAKIVDGNVTLAKLASGSVNTSKLAAGVYYNGTNTNSGGNIRYGTAAVGSIGGSPQAGDLYFKYI